MAKRSWVVKNKTAIEWLFCNTPSLKDIPFDVSIDLHDKFQEAFRMEKQQIIEAFLVGDDGGRSEYFGEKYYSRTYGNEA